MIERCRRHQLESDAAPSDVLLWTAMVGHVDIRYGSALSEEHQDELTPNPGAPYLMKLLVEKAEAFVELPPWDWQGGDAD